MYYLRDKSDGRRATINVESYDDLVRYAEKYRYNLNDFEIVEDVTAENFNSVLMDDLAKENTKIAKKIYEMLDAELFSCQLVRDDIWGFQHNKVDKIPNYVYSYLLRYIFKHYNKSYFFFGRYTNYKEYLKTLKEEGV